MMHVTSLAEYADCCVFNRSIIAMINALGNAGVSCFILISGYFGVKFGYYKIIKLVLVTTIYTLIVSFLNYGFDTKMLIKAFFCVPFYSMPLWFIVCYLFLMILSPYINSFVNNMQERDFRKFLMILFVLLCIIPTIFPPAAGSGAIMIQGGKCFPYFLFVFFIGRYLRIYDIKILTGGGIIKKILSVCAIILIVTCLNFTLSEIMDTRFFIFSNDCSPFILINSILLFSIFCSLNFSNRMVNSISSSVYGIFVLNYSFYFFDGQLFHLSNYINHYLFTVVVTVEVLFLMSFGFVIDKILGNIIEYLLRYSFVIFDLPAIMVSKKTNQNE